MVAECTMRLGGGLVALQQLKASGQLCQVLQQVGVVQRCPADALSPAQQRVLDKKIMCEVYHCCDNAQSNPRPDGERYSQCVEDVFKSVDGFSGWKSRYKAEVSYRDGQPIMFPPGGTRPWYPTAKVPRFPAGSKRPDVVAVVDPNLPPVQGNIDAIYEFKFAGDRWGDKQRLDYEEIAGDSEKVVEISANTCPADQDGKRQGVLETASAVQLAIDNARAAAVNQAAAQAATLWGVGKGAAWLGKGFAEAMGAFGRLVGAAP